MIGPANERTVAVWGRLQNIIVYQKSKTVWVATGKYMGEDHQAQGSNAMPLRSVGNSGLPTKRRVRP